MQLNSTLKMMLLILACYALLWAPAYFWPNYLDSPATLILTAPYLAVYIFHNIGIPGLLEHSGACGWGWCSPTFLGWLFLAVFWLLVVWLLARLIIKTNGAFKE